MIPIGATCIADDRWYGRYRGIIVGPHKNYIEPRFNVEIIECLRPPSDTPESCEHGNPLGLKVHRKQYEPGEIHHFRETDITLEASPGGERKDEQSDRSYKIP